MVHCLDEMSEMNPDALMDRDFCVVMVLAMRFVAEPKGDIMVLPVYFDAKAKTKRAVRGSF